MNDLSKVIETLAAKDEVKKVLEHIHAHEKETLDEQLELVAIKSPSRHEEKRAARFFEMMSAAGLDEVRMDSVGNVIGVLKGTGNGPTVVISGHMDTVFSFDVDCTPTVKEDGWIWAPGICDDTRGMVEVLAIAKAMCACGVRAQGDIWFVGNVGEETMGDLYGIRNIFKEHASEISALVSIDGTTPGAVCRTATAGHKVKYMFRGRGGHALLSFGIPNSNNAMGRAIAKIAEIRVPDEPKTIFNVGVVSGGVSINAIPAESSMMIDMRSADGAILEDLRAKVEKAVEEGLQEELARWNHPTETLTLSKEVVSDRPGGGLPDDAPIVLAAAAANDWAGYETKLISGSTDANIPLSMGIPGIAVGRGGTQIDGHAVTERFNPKDAYKGPQRAFLLLLELAGLEGVSEPLL
ncbi:MAG: M20/M25/M40 family metallo-hydrolase [Firmicutes bacterium]|nr:M20/M25/M40 family metallo-hydrolase [Bacillota bacterium]